MADHKKDNIIVELSNNYACLPEHFYEKINPSLVENPQLVLLNDDLLRDLRFNLDNKSKDDIANIFSGNTLIKGSRPIALAYAGHQYGYFVPQLGDGRAILLGEVADVSGKRFEMQLKGAGRTRFSRQGDGRSPLGPAIREYIISEFMHSLNIPTTRSLAVVTTGESVLRDKLLPGAVLTRLSRSHIRVGTFEYFAAREDIVAIKTLADYVISNYYVMAATAKNPYEALLKLIIQAQASLVAKWLNIGFIHGVMNTDNTSIVGETIDYGPCAFMDTYDPTTVFSSIDRHGRYAYNNQANIAQWNMAILANCFIPVLRVGTDEATSIANEAVASFSPTHKRYWFDGMCAKIGIINSFPDDLTLVESLLDLMEKYNTDFTLTFRYLCTAIEPESDIKKLRELFINSQDFDHWIIKWRARLKKEAQLPSQISKNMCLINPAFIPRNHLIEQAINLAESQNDFTEVNHLITVLSKPYNDQPGNSRYESPPKPKERVYKTFCGT